MDFIHERPHHALTRARACQLVEEELPTLIALAELQHALASRAAYQPGRASVRFPPSLSKEPDANAYRLIGVTPKYALAEARRLLDDVWDRAERGPYRVFHADAFNILARIERTAAEHAQPDSTAAREALSRARAAAVSAYHNAWLQGPPFAYAFGLAEAKQHLQALGVSPPELPSFDDSKYAPMPDVPIIPPAPEKSASAKRSRKRRKRPDG